MQTSINRGGGDKMEKLFHCGEIRLFNDNVLERLAVGIDLDGGYLIDNLQSVVDLTEDGVSAAGDALELSVKMGGAAALFVLLRSPLRAAVLEEALLVAEGVVLRLLGLDISGTSERQTTPTGASGRVKPQPPQR